MKYSIFSLFSLGYSMDINSELFYTYDKKKWKSSKDKSNSKDENNSSSSSSNYIIAIIVMLFVGFLIGRLPRDSQNEKINKTDVPQEKSMENKG